MERELNVLLILGLALFGGTVGGRIFQKIRIPQVVGYIVIGLIVGESGLKLIPQDVVKALQPFSLFALGLIGFMIGGELRRETFRKYGRQFVTILLAEGIGAFLVVGLLAGAIVYLGTGSLSTAVGLGLLLGAISSATAPAATVDVLWEYKTSGPLTTAVLAIVALDDGLALFLFGFASSIAGTVLGGDQVGLAVALGMPAYEIGGSLVLGLAAGLILNFILHAIREPDRMLAFSVGTVLLVSGLSMVLRLDLILAVMALGITIANAAPRRSLAAFELVQKFAPPIYVLFFVFVGARLRLSNMATWMWGVAIAYVLGRTGGKMLGAYAGAVWSKAERTVRRYLGLCLFSQAGVAIGLSILVGDRFSDYVSDIVIVIITTTTFLVQIIGPPCVKLAVKKAGEIGLNVTEEDLIRSHNVRDLMDRKPAVLSEGAPLGRILSTFTESDVSAYPVVDAEGCLLGLITLQGIKDAVAGQGVQELLVAYDLMEPVIGKTTPDTPLSEAMEQIKILRLDGMPVVRSKEDDHLEGFLDPRAVNRAIAEEIFRRKSRAGTANAPAS
ncbi:MAG: cation:proton antiporter [Planctomycetes bacterium]|nr:cation:proton antiporter [Planctomycetota bacterium]